MVDFYCRVYVVDFESIFAAAFDANLVAQPRGSTSSNPLALIFALLFSCRVGHSITIQFSEGKLVREPAPVAIRLVRASAWESCSLPSSTSSRSPW